MRLRRLLALRALRAGRLTEVCAPGSAACLSTLTASQQGSSARTDGGQWVLWPLAAAAAASVALVPLHAQADASESEGRGSVWKGLLSLDNKRRIFFKYEKRIRDNSTLDKVFDYFSSHTRDGVKYMTPLDLLAAIVPTYPPSQSLQERSGSLDGEPSPHQIVHDRLQKASATVFDKFDVDGDGVLSFWEYRLVLTLLAIPESDVEVIFNVVDLDGSGTVDAEEFEVVIASLEGRGPGSRQHTRALAARLGKGAELPSQATPSGLLVQFFGKDQKGKLKLTQFIAFLKQLHSDMVDLEFSHYDVPDKGSIPGVDYLRSMVAVADIRHIDGLLDKVDAIPAELLATPVSLADFRNTMALARNGHSLEVALHFWLQVGRQVTKEDLNRLVTKLCGTALKSKTLDMIMALFNDGTGHLDVPAFTDIIHRRRKLWNTREGQNADGSPKGIQTFWQCVKDCGIGSSGSSGDVS